MPVTTLPEQTDQVLRTQEQQQMRRSGDPRDLQTQAELEAKMHVTHRSLKTMFGTMLIQQRDMNTRSYDKEWIEKGRNLDFDYGLQCSQELAEFNESYAHGRWWGNQSTDFANCRTELVDALHFGMSMDLITYGPEEYGCRTIASVYAADCMSVIKNFKGPTTHKEVTASVKKLQAHVLTEINFNMELFYKVCIEVNMPIEILFNRYMGKAALNEFRQVNGYSAKPRTYKKDWGLALDDKSNEDNYYLAKFIDGNPGINSEDIKSFIEEKYKEVCSIYASQHNP